MPTDNVIHTAVDVCECVCVRAMKGMAQTKNKCSKEEEKTAVTNAAHLQVQKCARETVISAVF